MKGNTYVCILYKDRSRSITIKCVYLTFRAGIRHVLGLKRAQNIIKLTIWPIAILKSQELQFIDEDKMCRNVALQMKLCCVTEMLWPTNHILQM